MFLRFELQNMRPTEAGGGAYSPERLVHRYQMFANQYYGIVNKFGDGFMAVFGAPIETPSAPRQCE